MKYKLQLQARRGLDSPFRLLILAFHLLLFPFELAHQLIYKPEMVDKTTQVLRYRSKNHRFCSFKRQK